MAKEKAAVPVEDGVFYPEDLKKLQENHVIYIRQGLIINLDKL